MITAKTTTLTFRIEPELKEALRMAAEREHRSIANMVAVLIMDHCDRNGIPIPEDRAAVSKKHSTGRKDKAHAGIVFQGQGICLQPSFDLAISAAGCAC